MIKRNINNVRRMTSHPTLPYCKRGWYFSAGYESVSQKMIGGLSFSDLTGAQDGSVRMFEWGHSQQILCFRSPGNCRVTRIRFNHQGNKVRSKACAWFQNSRRRIPRSPPAFGCCCISSGSPCEPSPLRAQTACFLHESEVLPEAVFTPNAADSLSFLRLHFLLL